MAVELVHAVSVVRLFFDTLEFCTVMCDHQGVACRNDNGEFDSLTETDQFEFELINKEPPSSPNKKTSISDEIASMSSDNTSPQKNTNKPKKRANNPRKTQIKHIQN
ncbi:27323_t:CDS:2 [Racocetra persica]|uniref:27323_t:CDS:1 n=1 Tax=Racocetra persica TaxID=160502 RepID=A0ACA9NR29_9GLOM|nr:27323_t:CDS:2 [Racocetra persica]